MKKKRGSGKKNKIRNDNLKLFRFFLLAVVLLVAALYFLADEEYAENKMAALSGRTEKVPHITASPHIPLKSEGMPGKEVIVPSGLPRLSIIIDDIGYNQSYTDLINIGIPLTLAVIPFTPYAKDAAAKGNSAGMEIMLHLPMEPKKYTSSSQDKNILITGMDRESILGTVRAVIADIPHIKGVNNHMGSKFTESSADMKIVLEELRERGLFFIDSKTSNNSTGYKLAKSMGIQTAERSIFLDNVQTEKAIRKQFIKAVQSAKANGEAIAIGHPYPATVRTLQKIALKLTGQGVELVVASAVVR